jgi:UDP-N-acetylglucosamine--N-acetylmuramyl-(pentapeptide) pyrophosphoryl-undecaprenol N-acetylglucosamine transferase
LIENNIQVIWQCGANYLEQYKVYESPLVKVFGFIENIHMAYAAADIIVTRAGGAIFEMFVIGKPIIVLPSPYVAEDHQTVNAKALENQKAAIMIKDQEANEKLVSTIISLLHNTELQLEMQQKLKSLAKPNAASQIAEYVISFLNNKNTDNGRY